MENFITQFKNIRITTCKREKQIYDSFIDKDDNRYFQMNAYLINY